MTALSNPLRLSACWWSRGHTHLYKASGGIYKLQRIYNNIYASTLGYFCSHSIQQKQALTAQSLHFLIIQELDPFAHVRQAINRPNYSSFKTQFKISYGLKFAIKPFQKASTHLAVMFARRDKEMFHLPLVLTVFLHCRHLQAAGQGVTARYTWFTEPAPTAALILPFYLGTRSAVDSTCCINTKYLMPRWLEYLCSLLCCSGPCLSTATPRAGQEKTTDLRIPARKKLASNEHLSTNLHYKEQHWTFFWAVLHPIIMYQH